MKAVNNFQNRNRNVIYQPARKDFTRYPTVPQNSQNTSVCTNCGLRWSPNHCQICPANGKKCNNCGIFGHYARKSKKPKKPQRQVSKTPQINVNQDKTVEKSDDEESVNYITSYQQLYELVYDSNYDSD